MKSNKRSRTAEGVSAMRAVECYRKNDEQLFNDPFARGFLSPFLLCLVELSRLPGMGNSLGWVIDKATGISGHLPWFRCRTRCIDDVLREVLRLGCNQIVNMGSGYDTRAYRISGIEQTKVFEIDIHSTLQFKRKKLVKMLGQIPPHVSFVPLDFNKDDLKKMLQDSEFRSGNLNLFIWEGVTQYISSESVDKTLQYVADNSASGSRIVFSYIDQGILNGDKQFSGAKKLLERVRRAGEPWIFGLIPDELPAFLGTRGFQVVNNFNARDLMNCYFGQNDENISMIEFEHIAVAELR